jgi:hypothetical protein
MIEGRNKRIHLAGLLALAAALSLLSACAAGDQKDTARLPFQGVMYDTRTR